MPRLNYIPVHKDNTLQIGFIVLAFVATFAAGVFVSQKVVATSCDTMGKTYLAFKHYNCRRAGLIFPLEENSKWVK